MLETNAITRRADVTFAGQSFTSSLPAQSIVLFVLPPGALPRLRAGSWSTSNTLAATLQAGPGLRYVIESNTNLWNTNWTSVLTSTPATTNVTLSLPAAAPLKYFRAKWLP